MLARGRRVSPLQSEWHLVTMTACICDLSLSQTSALFAFDVAPRRLGTNNRCIIGDQAVTWALFLDRPPVDCLDFFTGPQRGIFLHTHPPFLRISSKEKRQLYKETVVRHGLVMRADKSFKPHNGNIFEVVIRVYDKSLQKDDNLSTDLSMLLTEGVLSDVVLQCKAESQSQLPGGGKANGEQTVLKKFKAHKAVLAARSPVFQRLFLTDMAEARSATVPVHFSPEVTQQLLWYIYTGQSKLSSDKADHENLAMDVLPAAHYYQIQRLANICEEILLKHVIGKPDKVLWNIVFADRYEAPKLKRASLDYAASIPKELRKRPEWGLFLRENRSLVDELFAALAEKLEHGLCSTSGLRDVN